MYASLVRPSSLLLVLVALVLAVLVQGQEQAEQHDKPARPFSRLQSTTGDSSSTRSAQSSDNGEADFTITPGYLLNLTKNGLNPLQAFRDAMNTKGFKAILDNSEIQHRVLEELPILGAIEGFNKIRGNRQLSDKDTRNGFVEGMENLMTLAQDAFINKVNDPAKVSATVAKMASSDDPSIKALFQRAQAGDKEAVEALQDEFTQQHYTGLDGKAFREISKAQNADKLEQLPEIMHFIEKEPSLAKVFKDLARVNDPDFPPTEEAMMAFSK